MKNENDTEIDIKSAAKAMNDRSTGLEFDLSVDNSLCDGGFAPDSDNDALMADLDKKQQLDAPKGLCRCFSLAYYQPYFNVDTIDVYQRLLRAFLPFKKNPEFIDLITKTIDAYGPFWIAATLIFSLACSSNLASYLDFKPTTISVGGKSVQVQWSYDFTRVLTAFTMVVPVYLVGFPFVLWSIGKYVGVPFNLSILLCLYGYSLVIFVPTSLVCIIPADAFDWVMVLLSMAWSLFFLLSNLWGIISEYLSKEKMLPVLSFMGATHLTWVILIKLLFF